jgi:hypothetical protein
MGMDSERPKGISPKVWRIITRTEEWRKDYDMSSAQLSVEIGKRVGTDSKNLWDRIVDGDVRLRADHITAIAEIFGCDEAEVVSDRRLDLKAKDPGIVITFPGGETKRVDLSWEEIEQLMELGSKDDRPLDNFIANRLRNELRSKK